MSAKGNSSPSGPGSPSSPPLGPDQTFIERDEPRPELPGETVVEGASSGASSGLGASLREFKGWRVVQGFPARGAEADIFLLEKERQQRILKLYRLGIRPKEEVFPKLQSVTQESPELFVQVYEQGLDPQTRRFFEMQEFFPLGTLKSLM